MAFEQLEPMGALHAEFIAGQICAVLANVNKAKDAKAFVASDFMPAIAAARAGYREAPEAVGLTVADPEKQSAMVASAALGLQIPPRWVPPGGRLDGGEPPPPIETEDTQ